MSVDIEPFELNFRRPFTQEVSETLTLRNPNATPVAFKVKTTAPKQYCVRPNAGRIEPGQEFDVTVLLQAFKQEPPLDTRCRDKFLVQSAPITSDKEFSSIPGVLESTEKALLQERKIRVNWLAASSDLDQSASRPSVSTPSKQSLANGPVDTPDLSRTYSSPSASEEPAPPSSLPPPYVSEDPKPEPEKVEEKPEVKRTIVQATTAAGTVAQAAYDEIKAKLAQAEAQVAALTLKESSLRQRNAKPAEIEKRPNLETAQAVRQTVEGVPVQSVAILCLISFLLAYLFF